MTKYKCNYTGKKRVFSTPEAGTTGYLHASKEKESLSVPISVIKN
jgi:hypothetical protein